jgi:hypothetical protein
MTRPIGLLAFVVLAPAVARADWDAPVNLGAPVNSEADEFGLSLTVDGSVLYFDSDRPGGFGGKDLYRSERAGAAWGAPENLGAVVNSPLREYCPAVSPNGDELIFTTEGWNLHTSQLVAGEWQAPVPIGTPVNSSFQEWAARFKAGDAIAFTAFERTGGSGGHDVWTSQRIAGIWQGPSALNLNTVAHEYAPFVAAGGDSMYLVVDGDIHVSHWTGSTWTAPAPIPGAVNHPSAYETSPVLSADGDTLYFASERAGGLGGYDFWYSVWTAGAVDVPAAAPGTFTLAQNEPNPFNPATTIRFQLAEPDRVRLAIYDVAGRLVRTLVDAPVGTEAMRIAWDGRDDLGAEVPSGTYLYRLQTSRESRTKKLSLVK